MIPLIEDIISGLIVGDYTQEQAISWLHRHVELAEEGGSDMLRDHFAGLAMQALITQGVEVRVRVPEGTLIKTGRNAIPDVAYEYADAMLAARGA